MSEDTAFQSVEVLVTWTLGGVEVVRGSTLRAAHTLVTAPDCPRRSYHETFSRPADVALRSAGKNFHVKPESLLSLTGTPCTFVKDRRSKLWSRMSPVGTRLASFQTMLTVPPASLPLPCASLALLTAIRGKSLAGNRL